MSCNFYHLRSVWFFSESAKYIRNTGSLAAVQGETGGVMGGGEERWVGAVRAPRMGLKRISHQSWPIVQAEFIPAY